MRDSIKIKESEKKKKNKKSKECVNESDIRRIKEAFWRESFYFFTKG